MAKGRCENIEGHDWYDRKYYQEDGLLLHGFIYRLKRPEKSGIKYHAYTVEGYRIDRGYYTIHEAANDIMLTRRNRNNYVLKLTHTTFN